MAMVKVVESGVDFDAAGDYTDPIPKAKLKELLKKAGMNPVG